MPKVDTPADSRKPNPKNNVPYYDLVKPNNSRNRLSRFSLANPS